MAVNQFIQFILNTDTNNYPDSGSTHEAFNWGFNIINFILLFYTGIKLANRNNMDLFWNHINFLQLYQMSTNMHMIDF